MKRRKLWTPLTVGCVLGAICWVSVARVRAQDDETAWRQILQSGHA